MKILAKDGKPLATGGKVIIPPSAGGAVNVSYNTVEPNRYSVNLNDSTAQLDLTGLVTGAHYICNINFNGIALDSDNQYSTGGIINYGMTVFSIGDEQYDDIEYSSQDFLALGPVQYNSNLILNLDRLLESAKNQHTYGMAYNITEVLQSTIVSWD